MAKFGKGSTAIATQTVKTEPETVPTVTETEVTTAPSTVDGDALADHAAKLAAKESKGMVATLERIAKAREDWQGGPLYTLMALRATYSPEELDEFPVPGSETGNNPDKFSITVQNGDKRSTRKTTFYAQFTRATGSGKALLQRLEWLERAADKGAVKDGIPEDISDMTPEQRVSHKSFCDNRLNTMTQAYKKAMDLHFKFNAVNEYADNITAEPIWEEGYSPDDVDDLFACRVVPTAEPIAVWMAVEGKPPRWEPFSIGAFLKLNPAKATEKGGGFKHLIESGIVKKAPGGGATTPQGAASEDITIKTVDRGLGVAVEFHRWFMEILGERDKAEYGRLVQATGKKDADEYVVSFVELKNILNDYCRDNKLDARYVKLKQAHSELVAKAS